jgi:DNA ligase (NAD+)
MLNLSDQELLNKIQLSSDAYYVGEAIMSDTEYDELLNYLKSDRPHLINLLPTVAYSKVDNHLKKFEHSFFVTGLDEIKSNNIEKEFPNLINDEYLLSNKLDGISVVCYYESGKFVRALTRHDGKTGLDISDNISHCNFPRKLPVSCPITAVRGEIVVNRTKFKSELSERYSTERNFVAGIANSKDSIKEHRELLEVVFYDIPKSNIPNFEDFRMSVKLDLLKDLGFPVVSHEKFTNLKDAINYAKSFDVYSRSDQYLLDGLVLSTADGSYKVKYPAKSKETTVKYVEWNVSNQGRVIPVIITEPVELEGAIVTRFSGFNAKSILDNGIGEGAIITVCRSNMVIPHWINTVKKVVAVLPIQIGDSLTKMNGVHLEVTTDLELSFIRNMLDSIREEGIGINQIVESLGLNYLYDLRELRKTDSSKIESSLKSVLGEGVRLQKSIKTVNNIFEKEVNIRNILLWSNLRGLGESAADVISDLYQDVDILINVLHTNKGLPNSINKLLPSYVPGESIKDNCQFLIDLLSLPLNFVSYKPKVKNSNGIKICITGSMSKTRKELLNDWSEYGVSESSVSSADYLVANGTSSSKYKEAIKLGIKVVSEEEFVNILARK